MLREMGFISFLYISKDYSINFLAVIKVLIVSYFGKSLQETPFFWA